jgi:hypothetical protein
MAALAPDPNLQLSRSSREVSPHWIILTTLCPRLRGHFFWGGTGALAYAMSKMDLGGTGALACAMVGLLSEF